MSESPVPSPQVLWDQTKYPSLRSFHREAWALNRAEFNPPETSLITSPTRGGLKGVSCCVRAALATCKRQEAQPDLDELKNRRLAQLPKKSRGSSASGLAESRCWMQSASCPSLLSSSLLSSGRNSFSRSPPQVVAKMMTGSSSHPASSANPQASPLPAVSQA